MLGKELRFKKVEGNGRLTLPLITLVNPAVGHSGFENLLNSTESKDLFQKYLSGSFEDSPVYRDWQNFIDASIKNSLENVWDSMKGKQMDQLTEPLQRIILLAMLKTDESTACIVDLLNEKKTISSDKEMKALLWKLQKRLKLLYKFHQRSNKRMIFLNKNLLDSKESKDLFQKYLAGSFEDSPLRDWPEHEFKLLKDVWLYMQENNNYIHQPRDAPPFEKIIYLAMLHKNGKYIAQDLILDLLETKETEISSYLKRIYAVSKDRWDSLREELELLYT